jgi:hypothetical protein
MASKTEAYKSRRHSGMRTSTQTRNDEADGAAVLIREKSGCYNLNKNIPYDPPSRCIEAGGSRFGRRSRHRCGCVSIVFTPSGTTTQPCALFIQTKWLGFSQLVSSSVPGLSTRTSLAYPGI